MAQNVELRRSNGTSFGELIYVKSHWSNIDGKPSNFPPTAHAHPEYLNLSGGTVGSLKSRYYYQYTNGEPSVNLSNPTIAEMALFEEQFDNKLAFYPPNNISFEVFDGSTWDTLETVTELQKKRLVGGDTNAGIQIPNGVNQFRITIRNKDSYVCLNALYAYMATQDNYVAIEIWKKRDDGGWIQHTSSSKTVSGWPGHIYLPFNEIPFSLSSTNGHYNEIRILFKPIWNNSNYIRLNKLQLWGGYPAGKRRLYSIDENKNAYFPATVYSNNKALVTTDDPRLSDARPASDVYSWAKQPTKPTYTYSEVGAAASSHVHTMNQITNLNETILNLAEKVHTHAITDITDLQTVLNNKANTNHTHSQYLTSADLPDSISDFISNTPSDGSFLAFSTVAGWMAINLTSNLIPDLPASKITSGTFNASRIPSLSADKITSGIFNISRIPTGTTGSTVALGNHTHSNYVTTSGTAYDSTRWGGYRIRTGSGLSGASGYITFSY